MKYHVHHGPYGSRGEARQVEYRDERNRTIASYTPNSSWGGGPATDSIILYSLPDKPHYRSLPHVDGRAEAICIAHLSNLGFTEHDERADTWDHRSMCD